MDDFNNELDRQFWKLYTIAILICLALVSGFVLLAYIVTQ